MLRIVSVYRQSIRYLDALRFQSVSYGNSSYRSDREGGNSSFRSDRENTSYRNREDNRGGSSYRNERSSHRSGGKQSGDSADFGSKLEKINWESEMVNLPSIEKNFHVEHPEVKSMSPEQCRKILMDANISIKGSPPIPKPLSRFAHAQLPDYIMNLIAKEGFPNPTSIQSIGWPIAMSGRDSVCVAQTGSGKTLGFVMPALLHVAAQAPLRTGDGPIVLILAPTRELVMQISKDASTFGRPGGVLNAAVFGGVSRNGQANSLRQGVEICVATPGRLLDFLESGVTNLKRVTYLVLDEADRMLDMGFEPQIRKIVSQIRPDRQTLMWSATWPKEIQKMAREFCKEDPVLITVGTSSLQANADVDQQVTVVDSESDKRDAFKSWMKTIFTKNSKMIIFTDTKKAADNLCRELTYNQYSALSLHGDKAQRERDQILRDFKDDQVQILVATDVAQRGLDVKGVDWVVNFDCPKNIEDYIHRIGRTGRAGAKGASMTFIAQESDTGMMKDIAKVMKDVGQKVPIELNQQKPELRNFMQQRK